MAIVRGQFAFVGEIPRAVRPEDAAQGSIESTIHAMPGLARAAILRRIDGEGIVIHETRTGGADDAQRYRRALEGHGGLEKQRWYRPVARWANPAGVQRVAFMRTFRVISAAGAKDTVVAKQNRYAIVAGCGSSAAFSEQWRSWVTGVASKIGGYRPSANMLRDAQLDR
jgi:hypothetical protein